MELLGSAELAMTRTTKLRALDLTWEASNPTQKDEVVPDHKYSNRSNILDAWDVITLRDQLNNFVFNFERLEY